jgi:NAD(P)H dehydrogenase (quinone)
LNKEVKMADEKKILVTGATGLSGKHVLRQLLAKGHQVRALAHKEDDRSKELQKLGAEVVYGDLLNLNDARAAVKGARSAYFVYPLQPTIVGASVSLAQAAKEEGLELIVNMSQLPARPDAESPASLNHFLGEQALNWSGVPTTHLRATFFIEWLLWIAPIIRQGKMIMPWGADSRYTPVTTEDLARAIVSILEAPKAHAGKTYYLVGPEQLSYNEVAEVLGKVLDKAIPYLQMEAGAFADMLGMGGYTYFKDHCKSVTKELANGVFEVQNRLIEEITGSPPMTVEAFVTKYRSQFAG